MSSRFFLVTSTDKHILSRGHSFFLAMDCMMAVRNDWGLKNPASHTVVGRAKSVVQASSSCTEAQAGGEQGEARACQCLQRAAGELPPPCDLALLSGSILDEGMSGKSRVREGTAWCLRRTWPCRQAH